MADEQTEAEIIEEAAESAETESTESTESEKVESAESVEIKKRLAEAESRLADIEEDHPNWKKVRDREKATKEEKKTLEEQVVELTQRLDGIQDVSTARQKEDYDNFLKVGSGGDEKLAEKIDYYYGKLNMSIDTPKQIEERRVAAITLAKSKTIKPDPVASSAFSMAGSPTVPTPKKKDFADTEQGKDMLKDILKGRMDVSKL